MAAGPLNHIVLAAGSVADDLGCVALADIARLVDTSTDYRVIGGLMVTALAYRWNLGASLYRETLDADCPRALHPERTRHADTGRSAAPQ